MFSLNNYSNLTSGTISITNNSIDNSNQLSTYGSICAGSITNNSITSIGTNGTNYVTGNNSINNSNEWSNGTITAGTNSCIIGGSIFTGSYNNSLPNTFQYGVLSCSHSNPFYNPIKNKIVIEFDILPIKMYMLITHVNPELIKKEFEKLTNISSVIIKIILEYHISISCTEHFSENEVLCNYQEKTYNTNNVLVSVDTHQRSDDFRLNKIAI
jgi:hypothetical protein